MSTIQSGRIVTVGLILYLDLANSRTYTNGDSVLKDLVSDYNASPQNSPTYITDYQGGFSLNGTDEYFDFNKQNPITGTSSFTISSWLDTKTNTDYGLAIFFGNISAGESFYLGYVTTANSGTSNSIGGGFSNLNFGTGILSNTGPHFLSMSYDGTSNGLRLYVDGVLKLSPVLFATPNFNNTSIRIGRSNSGTSYYYNGDIFSIQLYNRVLNVNEIQQNYNTTKTRFGL